MPTQQRKPVKCKPILFHWLWIPAIFFAGLASQGGVIHWP